MGSVSSEVLLALALVAIYVADSAHFLRIGEVLVRTRGGALQTLCFGWPFELGGRQPYLPNPLTPYWPDLRLDWETSGATTAEPARVAGEMRRYLAVLRPVRWLAALCACLIVVVAPVALALGAQRLFIGSALLCYATSAAACTVVALRRGELGLTKWQTAAASLIAIVCLPCSANLARTVSGHRTWTLAASDLPSLGLADRHAVAVTERRLRVVLDRAKHLLPEESVEYRVVAEQARKLAERVHEHH
jgi:hypothetical protein